MDTIPSILAAVAVVVALLVWRHYAARLEAARKVTDALQGEESRMFDFLHELGCAIQGAASLQKLYRMIVDGIDRVVTARGGALYLISEDGAYLVPQYVSEQCPPLVGVPVEILKRAERDPRALESHLRLANVPLDEGIMGHCLSVGEAIHVPDVKNDPAFRDAFVRFEGDVEALVAPLRHAGKDLGVLAVARLRDGGGFTVNDFAVFRSIAEQSAFAIGNARIHREAQEKRAIESELRTAREVQRVLLPAEGPVVSGYRITGSNLPARIISGDYYDFIDLGHGSHGVAIADVSGKGVPAGLLMAMCRSVLRSVAPGESSPARALAGVNRQLFDDIREDMFISMIYVIIDGTDGRMTLSRAGHDAAFCFRKNTGTVEAIKPPGLALGVDGGEVFERITRDHEISLSAGDCLLLFTDGVKEAVDAKEEEFGMDRVAEVFRTAAPLGAQAAIDAVYREVKAFTGDSPQMDDITLVAIEKR
jgi:sigma-B regulation protein RsbU (phosphoserine phosphatase)